MLSPVKVLQAWHSTTTSINAGQNEIVGVIDDARPPITPATLARYLSGHSRKSLAVLKSHGERRLHPRARVDAACSPAPRSPALRANPPVCGQEAARADARVDATPVALCAHGRVAATDLPQDACQQEAAVTLCDVEYVDECLFACLLSFPFSGC